MAVENQGLLLAVLLCMIDHSWYVFAVTYSANRSRCSFEQSPNVVFCCCCCVFKYKPKETNQDVTSHNIMLDCFLVLFMYIYIYIYGHVSRTGDKSAFLCIIATAMKYIILTWFFLHVCMCH